MAARIAMMAITTRSSISVNPIAPRIRVAGPVSSRIFIFCSASHAPRSRLRSMTVTVQTRSGIGQPEEYGAVDLADGDVDLVGCAGPRHINPIGTQTDYDGIRLGLQMPANMIG